MDVKKVYLIIFIFVVLYNGISRLKTLGPPTLKSSIKFEIFLVKVLSLMQKTKVLPATREKFEFSLLKKTASRL